MNDACTECGSTTWTAAIVDEQGGCTCAECFVGLTPLLARGVPIARPADRHEVERPRPKR